MKLTSWATALLGPFDAERDGWSLDPKAHAEKLSDEAVALRDQLLSDRHQAAYDVFARADEEAQPAQANYRRAKQVAAYGAALTATFGAVAIVCGAPAEGESVYLAGLRWTSYLGEALAIGVAAVFSFALRGGRARDDWLARRKEAEVARYDLFRQLLAPSGDPAELHQLRFEYFRKYLLDMQLAYYTERGKQHSAAASGFVKKAAVVTGVSAAVAAITRGLPETLLDAAPYLAVLGVVSSVWLTTFAAIAESSRYNRNVELYRCTWYSLKALSKTIDDVRLEVATGNAGAGRAFAGKVIRTLQIEHLAWLDEHESIEDDLDLSTSAPSAATSQNRAPP